jgi:hypothetical protein
LALFEDHLSRNVERPRRGGESLALVESGAMLFHLADRFGRDQSYAGAKESHSASAGNISDEEPHPLRHIEGEG